MARKFIALPLEKLDLSTEESRKKAAEDIYNALKKFVAENEAEAAAKKAQENNQ